ncbi:adenylate kinase 1, chloroplastic, partial [Tanacetum coccineum]
RQPIEDYYRKQKKLNEFDIPGGIPESWLKLLEVLNLDDYNHKKSEVA